MCKQNAGQGVVFCGEKWQHQFHFATFKQPKCVLIAVMMN